MLWSHSRQHTPPATQRNLITIQQEKEQSISKSFPGNKPDKCPRADQCREKWQCYQSRYPVCLTYSLAGVKTMPYSRRTWINQTNAHTPINAVKNDNVINHIIPYASLQPCGSKDNILAVSSENTKQMVMRCKQKHCELLYILVRFPYTLAREVT